MANGRIGLFGGSFNPPHIAHLTVAEAAREQARLDRVIWIPAATSPFKPDEEIPTGEHRLEMVRRAIEGNEAFEVSDLEIERGGLSYTIDTVSELAARYPEASLHLITGGDGLRSFPDWHRPREILEYAELLVYRRPADGVAHEDLPAWLRKHVRYVEAPAIALSATEIRKMLAAGRSVRYLVPDAVCEYLVAHDLYRRTG